MSTIESQSSSAFSHSNLHKVAEFAKYIADNWTAETGLILTNFAYVNGEKLIGFFSSNTGKFQMCVHLDRLPEDFISNAEVVVCNEREERETIPLRHIAGNY